MALQKTNAQAGPFLLLGDHPAMDMLNTQAGTGDNAVEFWNTGKDVADWCRRTGLAAGTDAPLEDDARLLADARELRGIARQLVEQRKAGAEVDPAPLNRYLHANHSAPHIGLDADGKLHMTRTSNVDPATRMVGALAESVGQLLAEGDFSLVKQCEHPDCVLWFYDRTKAHRRRWCSMTLCGNRVKAAQFRKRATAT
ncbi:CGNR zinc finger domain-containing protein [Massilia soli]|uniref:CGNR zinc finger domain-containing protein n=1 Tax=Massilia soli TaxID=2792854 RepID=A0ABS7SQM4_9BURK|nr:CGNR zinc finger domain-containing protein [Massilia soli]MBZ2208245.1 CGNR zinc finger domain-containing protein [Massilia soli]